MINIKQEIIRGHLTCTCNKAYKSRNMVDPTCFLCEYESEIEEMMDKYLQMQVEKLHLGGVIKSVCEMCGKEKELQSDNLCKECYDSLPS